MPQIMERITIALRVPDHRVGIVRRNIKGDVIPDVQSRKTSKHPKFGGVSIRRFPGRVEFGLKPSPQQDFCSYKASNERVGHNMIDSIDGGDT